MMKTSVSLYSYQLSYYIGKLDLEGCIREAAKAGSQGIELIAEQMPVGGSYPRVEWKSRMCPSGSIGWPNTM